MLNQIEITAIYSGAFLCLFVLGDILYHYLKLKVEVTRKFVHVFTGLICFTFPLFITAHWSVLFLTISFGLILILSIRFNLLKSINAVDRKTVGSYLFPVSIYVMYLFYALLGRGSSDATSVVWESARDLKGILSDKAGMYYFLPLLVFSISDPLAAIVGQRWPYGKFSGKKDSKTLVGSLAFFGSSLFVTILFTVHQFSSLSYAILIALLISLATTIAEGVSQRGFDNLLVPLAAILVLVFFI
jgi:phytol kinase|tara:strand:+ start:36199 stop:36930 length:732 start_codon:yes stop_codon:yes gene_type:complete